MQWTAVTREPERGYEHRLLQRTVSSSPDACASRPKTADSARRHPRRGRARARWQRSSSRALRLCRRRRVIVRRRPNQKRELELQPVHRLARRTMPGIAGDPRHQLGVEVAHPREKRKHRCDQLSERATCDHLQEETPDRFEIRRKRARDRHRRLRGGRLPGLVLATRYRALHESWCTTRGISTRVSFGSPRSFRTRSRDACAR